MLVSSSETQGQLMGASYKQCLILTIEQTITFSLCSCRWCQPKNWQDNVDNSNICRGHDSTPCHWKQPRILQCTEQLVDDIQYRDKLGDGAIRNLFKLLMFPEYCLCVMKFTLVFRKLPLSPRSIRFGWPDVQEIFVRCPRGGTRYILGWGGAARPLIPWPCLRQILLIFLPCLRQNCDFWYLFKTFKVAVTRSCVA